MKLKLNENYSNDFLTTSNGVVFYSKGNKLNKEYNIEDVNLSNPEIGALFEQGILITHKENVEISIDNDNIKTIKEIKTKNNIVLDEE